MSNVVSSALDSDQEDNSQLDDIERKLDEAKKNLKVDLLPSLLLKILGEHALSTGITYQETGSHMSYINHMKL